MSGVRMTTNARMVTERVVFQYLIMPCCQVNLCWVNPRYPTYCPECGKHCYPQVKQGVMIRDKDATLTYDAARLA